MGRSMCKNLIKNDYKLVVWNRSREKTVELQKEAIANVTVAHSALETVRSSVVTLMMLYDAAAVSSVLDELPGNALSKRVLVNMATISPDESNVLRERVEKNGGVWVEAPVLGSPVVAEKAALNIMVGCNNQADFEGVKPILSCLGIPRYFGTVGKATATKLSCNYLIGAYIVAFSESYAFLEKKNVNLDEFLAVLLNSPLNLSGDYYSVWSKKFKTRTYDQIVASAGAIQKDIGLVVNQFQQAGVHTAAAEGIFKHINDAIDVHHVQNKDVTAIFEAALHPKQ